MTRLKTAFVFLIIGLGSAFSIAASGPAISIDDMNQDLGVVAQGEVLEVEFEVENLGNEQLEIAVKPTCGCTGIDHDRVIAAGSSGTIVARIDTADFSGPTTKAVIVTSNDRQAGPLMLTIRADIK